MIEFTRGGKLVNIKVTGKHPISGWAWTLSLDVGSEPYAALLTDNFRQNLWDTIKEIRRESYERGWKDAKSHKTAKQEYFSGAL